MPEEPSKHRLCAEAISAVREIADLSAGSAEASDSVDVIEEVAAWSRVALHAQTPRAARVLEAATGMGLPEPVLAVTGAGKLEVPWTNYIFRALGGGLDSDEARGNALALAWMNEILGETPTEVRVIKEFALGAHACPTCRLHRHWCSLDLALVTADVAVAVEHKVRSPPSDFRYPTCNHPGSQARAYFDLFTSWAAANGRRALFRWLSPGGAEKEHWAAVSHEQLAEILAPAISSLPTRGDRYRAAAFVLDLAASVIPNFSLTLEAARAYAAAPEDDALASRFAECLDQGSHSTILAGVLDGYTG
jgi:hypothetical protein